MNYSIKEIERSWGREPGWFSTLPRQERADLLAWQRVHHQPEKKPKKRAAHVRVENESAQKRFAALWESD